MTNKFFNAHHAPIGAFASFTLGYKGNKGGFGLELGKPADQDIYIGLESEDGHHYNTFPFYSHSNDEAARYDVENQGQPSHSDQLLTPIPDEDISRNYTLSTDTFSSKDIEFTIYSQASSIPDPDISDDDILKSVLLPSVLVEITVDNRNCSRPRKAFFGFSGQDPYTGLRHFESCIGIGQGRHIGLTSNSKYCQSATGFTLENILRESLEDNYEFGIGMTGALLFNAPANKVTTFKCVVSFFRDGYATVGMDSKYYYTRLFRDLDDVNNYALNHFDDLKESFLKSESLLDHNTLSDDQHFMMIHAIRSYYGSTQLLLENDKPLFVVNEGEYRMMNTFDLTVDQLFYEMMLNPWTVKNELNMFTKRYSYTDEVFFPNDPTPYPGGVSFAHDMGVANVFSRPGHSSYEMYGISGCFSHMTHEQLVNWILCGSVYVTQTDDQTWLLDNLDMFEACLISMINRDHPQPEKRNGIMALDSSRTKGGAEITTYDSLDVSLGQARNNIYLAVKSWSAYVALEKIFNDNEMNDLANTAQDQAKRCADTLVSSLNEENYIPAVLESDNKSSIIPAIEGLVFPYFINRKDTLDPKGPYGLLIQTLKKHLDYCLSKDVCLFEDGGWKLSSTSNNSWLSKIYLCQFVAREILELQDHEALVKADKAHVEWLLHPVESYHCWSDQMMSGVAVGSKYYPRGVTSILWLYEKSTRQ